MNHLKFTILYEKDITNKEVQEYISCLSKFPNFTDTNSFYDQSFKPEMITELFDGWEKSKDTDIILSYSDKDYIIFWQKSIPSIMNVDYKDNNKSLDIQEYWTPCRLNDFINDCQQAGIELEWRQK